MEAVLRACEGVPEVEFAAGEVLIREGDRRGTIFVLVEGTLVVTKGDVRITRVRTPGALFGEMSTLLDLPYSATVSAETPVRALMVEDGRSFLASSPDVALHTARLLAQRLHDTTTYLADLKTQFKDKTDHFGMVDRIIETLLNQQRDTPSVLGDRAGDPRL